MTPEKALQKLAYQMGSENVPNLFNFEEFLNILIKEPEKTLRDIFQIFADMMSFFLYEEKSEKELLSIEKANFDKLFYENCEEPFFIDRLLANRLLKLTNTLKKGGQYGQIYLFEGPPGSGKSTFLNNILGKLEMYTQQKEGKIYQAHWKINDLEVTCPQHDHPIAFIPKNYRRDFLSNLLPESDFKKRLFQDKTYEWVWKDEPCALCNTIQKNIVEKEQNPLAYLDYLHIKTWQFDRQYSDGISVFNPGDIILDKPFQNEILKKELEKHFKKQISTYYSVWASTNNGVVALMDIKDNNVARLMSIHGLVSDGVHKVGTIEERIKSFFIGSVNPADKVHYEYIPSFQDRIVSIPIPYILDYKTEVKVYEHKFGKKIHHFFQPRIIETIAKIVIATRLQNTTLIESWLRNPSEYMSWLDRDLLLLKMEIYAGILPTWLAEDDRKSFDEKMKKELLREAEEEGTFGFSGRQSLQIFNAIFTKYSKNEKIITIEMVENYFSQREKQYNEIPSDFVRNAIDFYDFETLNELKESVYSYNESHIKKDILNYLFALNYEGQEGIFNPYTKETIDGNSTIFWDFEHIILGNDFTTRYAERFRNNMRKEYVSETLVQEIQIQGKSLEQTNQYKFLYDKYTQNLKENVLVPYINNENFRRAIQDFGTHAFNAYDIRMKSDVTQLISNLQSKFNYTSEGAKQICLYVLDKNLAEKFLDTE